MGKLTHIAGLHFSRGDDRMTGGTDHALLQVATVEGDKVVDSFILRFKGDGHGFSTQPPEGSKASEAAIFAPITEQQAQALKDFAGLLMQMRHDLPMVYRSGYESCSMPKDAVDVHGRGAENPTAMHMNCWGMIIMSCAVAGVDLDNFLQHRDMSAQDSQTRGMMDATFDNDAIVITRDEKMNYYAETEDADVPRNFIVTNRDMIAAGPSETLDAMLANADMRAVMERRPNLDATQKPVPDLIQKAAQKHGLSIPSSMKR